MKKRNWTRCWINIISLEDELFREYELPYVKCICNEARRRGIPLWKHSDGNLYPIIEDLIKAGISGLHPIEPPVMDLAEIKKQYGDKIFIAGNVDCRYVDHLFCSEMASLIPVAP